MSLYLKSILVSFKGNRNDVVCSEGTSLDARSHTVLAQMFPGAKTEEGSTSQIMVWRAPSGVCEAQTISILVSMSVQGSHLKAAATLVANVMFGRVF